jgi:hypothetical protein
MVVCWCEQAHDANLFMERPTFLFDMVMLFVVCIHMPKTLHLVTK